MTTAVLEIGPVTVRGPGTVSPEYAMAAVECIDDTTVLVGEQPMAVDDLWVEVIAAAAGAEVDALTLVCPTWWTADRIARIQSAVGGRAENRVLQRVHKLTADRADTSWAVVEIAVELVLVSRGDAEPVALVRWGEDDVLAQSVVDAVDGAGEVIVDAPAEVPGARALGRLVAGRIGDRGACVTMADPALLRREIATAHTEPELRRTRPSRRGSAVCAAVIALCAALAVSLPDRPQPAEPMAVLVEGRVGVQVPVGWTVQRITSGPGSARVEVVSNTDPAVAVHLTQSPVSDTPAAETLRRALDEQPAGVFVDFNPTDRIAERQVITYREVRAERHVQWAVLVDGPLRIAIGCQNPPGRDDLVRAACDMAVRSAHAVF
ncbi:type VII secretion-associated protein [Mycolicibacterium wolinskyi]|uniref:type VII secretion-associated protein n=1 Tax=Mycolicibacterium wolinskyi TaxID=59750 RepID=UPI00082A1624|nr:type VII secretion-associated protein [Mycolicibacterium wolinskyi]